MKIENYSQQDYPEKHEEYSYEEELLLTYSDYLDSKNPKNQN